MTDYSDRKSVEALAIPDPEYFEWLRQPKPPVPNLTEISALREYKANDAAAKIAAWGPLPATMREEYLHIMMRDGHSNRAKVTCPSGSKSKGPLIVLIHGGGFALGSCEEMTPLAQDLVRLHNATVVSVTYRLTPEWKWPTGHHDAWDAFRYICQNADRLGGSVDTSKGFVLGGVSAGANIAAVIAQQYQALKMRGEADSLNAMPALTGLWLCVPFFFNDLDDVPEPYRDLCFSREQNADSAVLGKRDVDLFAGYLAADYSSEWYSPYKARNPHRGLPRTYIQVDGADVLRDDGLIHAKVLRSCGVETRLDVWPGLPHAHAGILPPDFKCVQSAVRDLYDGFAWLLETD